MGCVDCPKCKHWISDEANYCPNCGFKLWDDINHSRRSILDESSDTIRNQRTSQTAPIPKDSAKSTKSKINGKVISIMIIAVLLVTVILTSSPRTQPSSTSQDAKITTQSPSNTSVSTVTISPSSTTVNTATRKPSNTSANIATVKPKKTSSYASGISDDLKYALAKYAEKRVTAHLKAPSTAKFPSYTKYDYSEGTDDVYIVVGYVDSQNSYGAMIRSTWGAMIQYDGTYSSLVTLTIDDELYFQ